MRTLLTLLFCTLLSPAVLAQSIDLGRGEIPVAVPADYDAAEPTPLIVLLHGYGSNGPRQTAYIGLGDIVDDYGFLLASPTGTRETQGRESTFWNASDACCNFYGAEIDDVGYIMDIIAEMQERYNVDERRIYLVGHSNGGFMSYRVAYEHSETIAAIVSLAGATQLGNRPAPAAPVNILQIHGTADSTIAYQGGDIQDNRYPGARATVAQWAGYNGCNMEGRAREIRDLDATLPGHESGVLSYTAGCEPGGMVELWTISAGSHVPPLSDTYAAQVVEWLYAHPKPEESFAD